MTPRIPRDLRKPERFDWRGWGLSALVAGGFHALVIFGNNW